MRQEVKGKSNHFSFPLCPMMQKGPALILNRKLKIFLVHCSQTNFMPNFHPSKEPYALQDLSTLI